MFVPNDNLIEKVASAMLQHRLYIKSLILYFSDKFSCNKNQAPALTLTLTQRNYTLLI
ncbi:hypothetical protein MPB2EB_0108 [Mycoavidus sp. B2-EB]|nr:hypothetical protein MPB2EB_0108 [Mycoavidus sp. B2-EB]